MARVSALVALLALAACSSSSSPPPALLDDATGHPDGAGVTMPFPSPSEPATATKIGGAVGVAPGTRVGYALIAIGPKSYQLRWTGDAAVTGDGFKEFYGSVWTAGTFTSTTPGCLNQVCPLESGDLISAAHAVAGGQRIDWDTFASTGWDGFAFATDTEPVFFDVFVDGKRRPDLVLMPSSPDGAGVTPTASPFSVTSGPLPARHAVHRTRSAHR